MTESTLLNLDKSTADSTPDFVNPPTQDELLYDDGIPMETYRHKLQMDLLVDPLAAWLGDKDAFVGGNMFVYFSPHQLKNHDFRGPDMFAVLDVPKGERKCWVTWEEGKGPDVVVELLSSSTASKDKTDKKEIYQNRLRVPEYFWYDPFNPNEFAGFIIRDHGYEPIIPDEQNRLISQKLGLALVHWAGEFGGANAVWVRWATLDGVLLPTARELAQQAQQEAQQAQQEAQQAQQEAQQAQQEAQQAQQEAQQAQQEAQQAQQRAEAAELLLTQERQQREELLAKLQTMGINPDQL
jgi:Uma2 family endonuclease